MKSRVEIKSSDRRLMGVVIPALSDNGFVNITLAMKVLSDDRLKKGLSPKKLNDIIKYDGFQEKCREIISRLENRDLYKRHQLHFLPLRYYQQTTLRHRHKLQDSSP